MLDFHVTEKSSISPKHFIAFQTLYFWSFSRFHTFFLRHFQFLFKKFYKFLLWHFQFLFKKSEMKKQAILGIQRYLAYLILYSKDETDFWDSLLSFSNLYSRIVIFFSNSVVLPIYKLEVKWLKQREITWNVKVKIKISARGQGVIESSKSPTPKIDLW